MQLKLEGILPICQQKCNKVVGGLVTEIPELHCFDQMKENCSFKTRAY